jgi:hypothetical protein
MNRGISKVALSVVFALSLAMGAITSVRAHDIPDEIIIQAFVKPEGDRLHFLVRIPLIMLANINLPKRGPGYIDLTQVDPALQTAVEATSREIQLYENGTRLTPVRSQVRISQPSERFFETYEQALAHVEGPALPETANVFWNQGFFDAYLEYPIRSDQSDFSLDLQVAPGLSGRIAMLTRFISPGRPVRVYEIRPDTGRVALDPHWYQAAWLFVKSGFFHIFSGIDHLLFLLCLVIPFHRGNLKRLIPVVTSFTIAHSITLIASAYDLGPAGDWFPPLVETLIAASIVYMALENVVTADLGRRWLITGGFGLVHGFGFSYGLKQNFQFAGDHLLLSLFSFNLGVEIGQLLVLLLALPALYLLFRYLVDARIGAIIMSALLAHTGWHWMVERAENLRAVTWPVMDAATMVVLARWALILLLTGGAVWLVRGHIERLPVKRSPQAEEDLA